MAKKIEQQVADTILQRTRKKTIAGVEYEIRPPTVETVILMSELIAELPKINHKAQGWEKVTEMLKAGRNCRILGDIVALQILGPKELTEERIVEKKYFFGLIRQKETVVVNKQKELAKILLTELEPEELRAIHLELLTNMQVGSFFSFTASLAEVNLLKPTTEAGTTAFGL